MRGPGELAARGASLYAASGGNWLDRFAAVPDPRGARDPAFPAVEAGAVHGGRANEYL
jgi:hypothetical protein